MEKLPDVIFDKIMESVGDKGPFQNRFNYIFNVGAIICASMAYMNIILAMNVPDHWCNVPGREMTKLDEETWKNITLPREIDNRGVETYSSCRMYNISSSILNLDYEKWNLTDLDIIDNCKDGYVYDKKWYEQTAVSQENWVCDREIYATNTFMFNRIGEVVGTMVFGQLGDILGRKPIFYISTLTNIFGRLLSVVTSSYYFVFAIAAIISMLTSYSIFQAPLIIAMETSKSEDWAHIAMMQCIGWTLGMCIVPMVFWWVRYWVWFLVITTLPFGIFIFFPRYMIESPRWLASKGHYAKCAVALAKIAKINGKKVEYTEKSLRDLMPNNKVEKVYGIASLFTCWRLAKNTVLIILCWTLSSLVFFTLVLNTSKMDGNPFLNFLWQSAIELPAYIIGRMSGDKLGRRFTNTMSFVIATLASLLIMLTVINPNLEIVTTCLVVMIKFGNSITFYVIVLLAMEIYPTCIRQTGISMGTIVSSLFGVFGPYIVNLGTNYDVRYPYLILCLLSAVGVVAALLLPETLHQKLPETIVDAKDFGKNQAFWSLPKSLKASAEESIGIATAEDKYMLQTNEFTP